MTRFYIVPSLVLYDQKTEYINIYNIVYPFNHFPKEEKMGILVAFQSSYC